MEKTFALKEMTSCPLCGSGNRSFSLYAKVGELKVNVCRCTMKFLNPYLAEEEMKEIYDTEGSLEQVNPILKNYYSFYHAYKGSRTHRTYLRVLRDLAMRVSGKSLLDVGSGNGIFLEVAKSEGWKTEGIDSSPTNVEFAKSRGLEVTLGGFGTPGLQKEHFDVITLWDVIEHTANPVALLQKCRETVKTGGHVVIATPNDFNLVRLLASFLYRLSGGRITQPLSEIYVVEHILYFSKDTLCSMLKALNFDVERVVYDFTDLKRYQMNPVMKAILQVLFWVSAPFQLTNRVVVIARKKTDVGR